ncbi:MAG: acetylxylan esterase [Opitutus sp.]|nr:acetylxylan esterase [Opitutus sp.]
MSFRRAVSALLALGAVSLATSVAAAPFYPDKNDLLYYLDQTGARHPVATQQEWNRRRNDVIANMQVVMGPLPVIDHRLPLAVEVLKEGRLAKASWRRITYVAEAGDRAYAYLYIPDGLNGRRAPAIVSLHGTTYPYYVPRGESTPDKRPATGDTEYAQELAERGYVVIAPDYVLRGPDYKTDPYKLGYASGTMKGIVNHIRAVDVLASLPEVDAGRIGAIGLSLGGHNALFLGVFEPRIRAMVSSAGFNTFFKYYSGKLKGWTSDRYMPRIASEYGNDPARMPFDFTEILGVLAPRPVFVNAPRSDDNFEVSGVKDCVTSALPVYDKIFQAADNLVAQYPEGGHGFAPAARQAAYEYLDRWLALKPAGR